MKRNVRANNKMRKKNEFFLLWLKIMLIEKVGCMLMRKFTRKVCKVHARAKEKCATKDYREDIVVEDRVRRSRL